MTPEKFLTKISDDKDNLNLLPFDETKPSTGKDINTKITALDVDLAELRMELGTINSSVEEGLDRLGDTDTDLTAKVSETYKRLGEIDNAYKSLLEISARINNDIQKLDGDVSTVAEQSATGIKDLELTSLAQSHEFTQKNEQVVTKVKQLVETSKLSNDLLAQKIQSTTEVMSQIEKRVISEIETLSKETKDKSKNIETTVEHTRANIIKLQSIDEAIIRRATTLEITSAELSVSSLHMNASIEQLDLNSDVLEHNIDKLKERTTQLEETTARQSGLISGLQKTTFDIADKLSLLAGRESRHFNIVTGGFLLLVLASIVMYITQQNAVVERASVVNSNFTRVDSNQVNTESMFQQSLAALENKMDAASLAIKDEFDKEITRVDKVIKDVEDQAQSVAGRVSEALPFSQIGNDNVIHGEQWIADLPKENFVVQLAYTANKDVMYELADRYNYYLKESLSYFVANDNGVDMYVLLSGNYAKQADALRAIDTMPKYIDMQKPVLRSVESIQGYLSK